MNQTPIISSRYWNMVHSNSMDTEKLVQDEEGIQIVRMMCRNMAYFLKCMEAGKEKGIVPSEQEQVTLTNFIR